MIKQYRITLLFITFTRCSRLQKVSSQFLKKDTIQKSIEDIRETIEIQGLGISTNLFINKKGKLCYIIMKILKLYQVKDPSVKRDSPTTLSILRFIKKKASSKRDHFISNLMIGAYFFVMRSCKYSKTSREPRSTIITTNHITFMQPSDKCLTNVLYSNSKVTLV